MTTQLIYDATSGVWVLEDTDGLSWRELARGTAASEAEAQSAASAARQLRAAYEALAELLATPELTRPAGAQDADLVPIHDAIAARIQQPAWRANT
jgi:hypothetical protein